MPLPNLTKLLSYLEFGISIAGWFDRNKSEEDTTSHPAAKQANTENSFQLAQPTFLQRKEFLYKQMPNTTINLTIKTIHYIDIDSTNFTCALFWMRYHKIEKANPIL